MKQFLVSIHPMFHGNSNQDLRSRMAGWEVGMSAVWCRKNHRKNHRKNCFRYKNKRWYILNNMVKSNNYCILLLVPSLKQLTWKSCSSELELFCEAWRCKLQWSGCHPVFFMSIFRSTFPRTSLHMHPWKVFDKHMRLDETKGKVRVPSECDRIRNALEKTCTLCTVQM